VYTPLVLSRPRIEVERAASYIQAHLGDPLTVAQISSAAGMSEFHLHREFHRCMGEPVGRFVTRKRLETAALRLASEPSTPITTIALEVGYSSSSNFSKAFKLFFGVSPLAVRSPDQSAAGGVGRLLSEYDHAFVPSQLFAVPFAEDGARREEAERWQNAVRFERLESTTFVSLASPSGYEPEALAETWRELIDRCFQLGVCDQDVDAWGMAHDSPELTAPDFRRYHACVRGKVPHSVPAPLFTTVAPPGRFAVFRYEGPVDEVAAAYRSIYSCWFPESSLVPGDYLPLDHYVGDEPRDGKVEMEMWFRVE
jgi:AraC family transcriptional regulator